MAQQSLDRDEVRALCHKPTRKGMSRVVKPEARNPRTSASCFKSRLDRAKPLLGSRIHEHIGRQTVRSMNPLELSKHGSIETDSPILAAFRLRYEDCPRAQVYPVPRKAQDFAEPHASIQGRDED